MQPNGHRSGGTEVRSGVLQGFVVGPFLFKIFKDDINEDIPCEISKFAVDMKIAR